MTEPKTTESKGSSNHDLEMATWDGPSDPENPYNWPTHRKVAVGIVCSGSSLVTTMSASMVAPALDQILHDVGMSPTTGQISFSVFFLGLAFAPFIVAPLAETYGRRPVWLVGNIWYIIWNSLCPAGFLPGLMITGRFMSAAGASVGITLTAPVLADIYTAKDRGKAMAIAGLLPYIGPALGPIVGGIAAQRLWWPWLFWILSAFDLFCLALGFLLIRETYAPVLLRQKARKVNAIGSDDSKPIHHPKRIDTIKSVAKRLQPAFAKPIQLLLRRPIIQIVAISLGVDFGIYTLVLSTFASLWINRYDASPTIASLHYIAIALGALVCAQGGGRLMDYMWRRIDAANPNTAPTPEYRISYMTVGLLPGIAGLFWYAWAAERAAHWVAVDTGIFVFTCGTFMFSQGLMTYIVDEFGSKRAASAGAATRVGTYVLGFSFPIFAPNMYEKLGYGWGNTLLAFLLTAVTIPVVAVLWLWGSKLRAVGRDPEDENAIETAEGKK